MRVAVVQEFVEPGQSAQIIEKRPQTKKMLRYIN